MLVSSPLFKSPKHLVKEWPEVFEDMYMNTMPVEYLEYVHLEFANGRVWQINIKEQLTDSESTEVAAKLIDTMSEYQEDIVKLDFKVDIAKLKKDVGDSTSAIF